MSYDGQVRLGAISDEGAEPGPESFIASFHDEFAALLEQAQRAGETPSVHELSAMLDTALVGLDDVLNVQANDLEPDTVLATVGCQALTRAGRQCRNHPPPGSSYCRVHA